MSRIFTDSELKEIKNRQEGNFKDKTGVFSNRIRPKITELLNVWFPKKKELMELIESKRGSK